MKNVNLKSTNIKRKVKLLFMSKVTICFLALVLIGSSFSACRKIDKTLDELTLIREQTIFSMDEAIRTIENAPSDWQYVLEGLADGFVHDIQSTIRNDVQQLLNNSIGAATTNIVCVIDAIPIRAIRTLENIKVKFLGGDLPTVEPTICQQTMNVLDLAAPIETRKEIIFFGFDMVEKVSFDAELVLNNPTPAQILGGFDRYSLNDRLNFQSNYQFTVDLSGLSDDLIDNYDYIAILFNGEEISSISIQQDDTPLETQTVYITPSLLSHIPPHVAGDREFDGNGPDIFIHVRFYKTEKQVYLKVWMKARETQSDWTEASGWSNNHFFYTAPEGWHIKKIEGETVFDNIVDFEDHDHATNVFNRSLGQFAVVGDTPGDEAGTETGVSINFSYAVPIVVEKDE